MAITFSCSCGKSYTVADELAGKRTRCPACRAALVVPAPPAPPEEPLPELEIVEDAPARPDTFAEDDRPPVYLPGRDQPEVVEDLEPEVVEEAGAGRPEYFVAAFLPTLANPKTYRVYPDGDELLFVHAGPFSWTLAGSLTTQDNIRNVTTRTGAQHGAEVGLALGLAAKAITAVTDLVARRDLAKRAAVLDPMTLDELRAEAEADKHSFVVSADNTTDARIDPPPSGFWAGQPDELDVGRVKFRHDPTGKWELVLLSKADAKAAIRAFRRALGRGDVDVSLRFKKERA